MNTSSSRDSQMDDHDDNDDLVMISLDTIRSTRRGSASYQSPSDNEINENSTSFRNLFSRLKYYNLRHPRLLFSFITLILFGFPFILTSIVLLSRKSQIQKSSATANQYELLKSKFYVSSRVAAVATDVGVCSDLGKQILVQGGNAMDAAVTTTLCLGVMNPASSGLGGGCYILNYNASNKDSTFIDSREVAGEKASPDMFNHNPLLAQSGGLAIAVLGELKGLYLAWQHHGGHVLSWKELVMPVANIANQVVISPELHLLMKEIKVDVKSGQFPELTQLLLNHDSGELKKVGDIMLRPKLAYTLQKIAEEGPSYLYDTMAATLAKEIQDTGGILTEQDIRSYQPLIHPPIQTTVFGHTYIGASGSSSGGVAIPAVMKYMSGYSEPLVSQGSVYYHRLAEALKHVFAMRMSLGDPAFVNASKTIQAMLSDDYMAALRMISADDSHVLSSLNMYGGRFNMSAAPLPRIDSGTSHVSIIDSYGNAVSLTSTINTYFGSKVISPSTGIVFNNEMDDFGIFNASNFFGLYPQPNNYPEPKKRPLSSMSPSLLFTPDERLKIIGGGSGGPRIITGTVQMFMNIVARGMDVYNAVISPRIHTQLLPNTLCVEDYSYIAGVTIQLPHYVQESLKNRNHTIQACNMFGYTQFIVIDTDDSDSSSDDDEGTSSSTKTTIHTASIATATTTHHHPLISAVSDPRKDGRPAGV